MTLTAKRLKELVRYDPITGFFTWAKGRRGCRAGDTAGRRRPEDGYWQVMLDGKQYYYQRLAVLYMTGRWPAEEADHKSTDKDDHTWENIRQATYSQNQQNKPKQSNNTSGYKGVTWNSQHKKWFARISVSGKRHHLGYFADPIKAHKAYCRAANEFHKQFARVA